MSAVRKIIKGAVSIVGGLVVAEGLCVVSNALVEDIARVKGGFDRVIAKPIEPPVKLKRKWGKK